jgi:hypothetical protein
MKPEGESRWKIWESYRKRKIERAEKALDAHLQKAPSLDSPRFKAANHYINFQWHRVHANVEALEFYLEQIDEQIDTGIDPQLEAFADEFFAFNKLAVKYMKAKKLNLLEGIEEIKLIRDREVTRRNQSQPPPQE